MMTISWPPMRGTGREPWRSFTSTSPLTTVVVWVPTWRLSSKVYWSVQTVPRTRVRPTGVFTVNWVLGLSLRASPMILPR